MENLVMIKDNQVVVSSRQVAEHFGKRHDNVSRDIKALQKDILNFEEMFKMSESKDSYGRNQNIYLMNRDGFTLLTMGFTGRKALQWKLKYITAFNEMEKQLQGNFQVPQTFAQALMLAAKQQEQLELQAPKVKYHDDVLDTSNYMTSTEIAKSEGLRSAQSLNEILEANGVIFRVGYKSGIQKPPSYYPYAFSAKYIFLVNEGYAKVATIIIETSKETKTRHTIKWSEKGREWIHNFLYKVQYKLKKEVCNARCKNRKFVGWS